MALTQLGNPFPVFVDLDGSPLDGGYLYFGTADLNPETNPIAVYYDAALTQPAAQPLRTSNGFVIRDGSPTSIFANSTFSVTVRNRRSALVLYAPDALGAQSSQNSADIAALDAAAAKIADNETITGDWTFEGSVDFAASPLFNMPSGPTAERPASPVNGTLFHNTTTGRIDVYYSGAWLTFGAIIDDDTLAAESDTRVPTQGNVKTYVDATISAAEPIRYESLLGSSQGFDGANTGGSPLILGVANNVPLEVGVHEIMIPIELMFVGTTVSNPGNTAGVVIDRIYLAGTTTDVNFLPGFTGGRQTPTLFPRNKNDSEYAFVSVLVEMATAGAVDINLSAYTISATAGDDFIVTIGAPKVTKVNLVYTP